MTDRQMLRIIGQNIRVARLRANMTQECLAELAGVHAKTFGRIERGQFSFATTIFVRLTQHLQINASQLIEGLPQPDRQRMERITKALARKRKPRNPAS